MPTIPTLDDWLESLRSLGAKPEHIRKIARALLGRAPWPTVEDERLPKRLRTALPEVRAFWTSLARMVSNHPGASGERLLLELPTASGWSRFCFRAKASAFRLKSAAPSGAFSA